MRRERVGPAAGSRRDLPRDLHLALSRRDCHFPLDVVLRPISAREAGKGREDPRCGLLEEDEIEELEPPLLLGLGKHNVVCVVHHRDQQIHQQHGGEHEPQMEYNDHEVLRRGHGA